MPVQKIVETMARFVRGKKFETTVRFLTLPVQKRLETMPSFVRENTVSSNRWISNNPSAKHC